MNSERSDMGKNTKKKKCYHPPDQILQAELKLGKEIRKVASANNILILVYFNYPHID